MAVAKKHKKRLSDTARARVAPKRQFPAHLRCDTQDEWRALKRTEWREVVQAVERYNYGSAYTPAYGALYEMQRAMRQVTEAIEAPDWIAW